MDTGNCGLRCAPAVLLGAIAIGLACGSASALAGDTVARLPAGWQPGARGSVETVYFSDRRNAPVKLVRGAVPSDRPIRRETVSFGNGTAERVTIVRGTVDPAAAAPIRQAALAPQQKIEQVRFADPELASVIVVRGGGALRNAFSADLFGPASDGDLDRVAHAVHGAESNYGKNPRMWRPEFDGPQGPMQVSAAAALDVGGGNRFDLYENRLLGRAYLAQMYRRYGNWPDALAAYNWGPGNVDQWIARGRNVERLPDETIRYVERVLRDALITTIARRF